MRSVRSSVASVNISLYTYTASSLLHAYVESPNEQLKTKAVWLMTMAANSYAGVSMAAGGESCGKSHICG